LARRLSIENNIKNYEIDSIVHDDNNNVKRSIEEQIAIIDEINRSNNWIIEGTLRKKLDILLDMADLIIYIDISVIIRKRRIIWRFIKQKLRIEKCNYKSTLKLLRQMYLWTDEFEKNKLHFENRLAKYNKKLIRLDTVMKVNSYKL